MRCTVQEAQERLDSIAFSDWLAYDALAPIGPERIEIDIAYAAAGIAAALGVRAAPEDYRPIWHTPPEPPQPENGDVFARLQQMGARTNERKRSAAPEAY